jgi:alpha-D-xyloside xylohydrolase
VYKRWCAFGLLSSHSRLHGSSSYRVPWLFDDEAVDVLRHFTKLKCRLMPHLFGAACQAHERGLPVMRAMPLAFPGDPACDTLDRQYMLGDSLLVAPVFSPEGVVDYYLPAGRWTHFLSGEVIEGGRWLRETHGYLSLPLMARPNSIIAVGANEQRPDYDFADGVTFHVFELADGAAATTTVPTLRGGVAMTATARREGKRITVQVDGPEAGKPWRVLLRGVKAAQAVEGGTLQREGSEALVVAEKGKRRVVVQQ